MSEALSVVLSGIGGYGEHYLPALLDDPRGRVRIAGAVDPNPANCSRLADIERSGVPIYPSMEAFYEKSGAELAILSSPLHLHAEQTCLALARGSHVLCEKPLCVTPADARRMIAARDAAQKHVAIGYQWSFSRAVQKLKGDVLASVFGKPRRLRTLVLWPRDAGYYRRNGWAGRIKTPAGAWVLDSPVNNACAHYLHHMLYVIGDAADRSAEPERLGAELYRANPIENYDTAALRGTTKGGAEFVLVVSHAVAASRGPEFVYEFERGTVSYSFASDAPITATLSDGNMRNYGTPAEDRNAKLWATVEAIREGRRPICGIEAAMAHTQCVWTAQQCVDAVAEFPKALVRVEERGGKRFTSVSGLDEVMDRCYREAKLPSETGAAWAKRGREVVVADAWK